MARQKNLNKTEEERIIEGSYKTEESLYKTYKIFWPVTIPIGVFLVISGDRAWKFFEHNNLRSIVVVSGVLLSFFSLKLLGLYACVGVYLVGAKKKIFGSPCITLMNCTGPIIDIKISFDAYATGKENPILLAQKAISIPYLDKPAKKARSRTISIPVPVEMQKWGSLDDHYVDVSCVYVHELTNHRAGTRILRLDNKYFDSDAIDPPTPDDPWIMIEMQPNKAEERPLIEEKMDA